MEDFKKCYEFYNKNEATINLISNDSLRDFYRAQNYEEQIWVLNRNLKRRKDANKINTDYLDFIFGIEVIDISHYNCKKVDKKIGSYTIPFFQITFDLPDFFYPIIEFDVNANGKIDSTIDTRYFYNYHHIYILYLGRVFFSCTSLVRSISTQVAAHNGCSLLADFHGKMSENNARETLEVTNK